MGMNRIASAIRKATALSAIILLGACATEAFDAEVEIPKSTSASVIDETNLNDLMLTLSDPEDAVAYFRESLEREPSRLEFKRGYALSLARSRRHADAVRIFEELDRDGVANPETRLEHAHSLARLQRWEEAENQMALVGSNVDVPRRHLIDAMLA
ncbi:MAG: tetratricopeptide repeat protein, partial [Pseudomonadota bacterium]